MFKIPRKQIIVNRAEDLLLLEANPVAAAPVAIGEGTSRDDFDGFVAGTSVVHITPIAASFTRNQLVKVQKTVVKANSIPYGVTNPNYATPVNGLLHGTVLPNGSTIVAQSVEARRDSVQTATYTVNAVPAVGSIINLRIQSRSQDRNITLYQQGFIVHTINIVITPALNTPTLIAARIAAEINQRVFNDVFPIQTVSSTGAVVTMVGKVAGVEFNIYQTEIDLVDTQLDATFAVTVPAWNGINNFKHMDAYQQVVSGYWDKRDTLDVYLPVQGVYYTSYHITYRHNSVLDEQQADSVNVEQSHLIELLVYVNPALTALVTKLDLLGGF